MTTPHATIVRLEAENFRRLKAVRIEPGGNPLVEITGPNGAGKTSVLDAVAAAIGGKDWAGRAPLRRGEDRGSVEVTLSDGTTITRTFSAGGGGTLVVTNADRLRYPKPQALLDKMLSAVTFDPLEFCRMKPVDQGAVLRRLAGIDHAKQALDRQALFDTRTDANRRLKAAEARLAGLPAAPNAPAERVDTEALVTEQGRLLAGKANQVAALRALNDAEAKAKDAFLEVDRLTALLAAAQSAASAASVAVTEARAAVAEKKQVFDPERLAAVNAQLAGAAEANRLYDAAVARGEAANAVAMCRREAEQLTARINGADAAMAAEIAAAKYPVEGLAVGDDGPSFHGLPLDSASAAERIRISTAVGLALNPALRVLLIRDGSLLDDAGLRSVAEMAAAAGAQVWIERVEESGAATTGFAIEDGEVCRQTKEGNADA